MKQIFLDTLHTEDDIQKLVSSFLSEDILDLEVSYISDFKSAKKLRYIVDSICVLYSISPKWRSRLVLICDELNNNAIEYGSREGDINIFRIVLQQKEKGGHICISVGDSGQGESSKNSHQMQEIKRDLENLDYKNHKSIRGRGLFLIINQLVDSLEFFDGDAGGLTVKIEKNLD